MPRAHPTRKGWWQLDVYIDGKRRRPAFQGTELEAIEQEQWFKRKSRQKKSLGKPHKISQIVPDYLAEYTNDHRPQGVERTQRSIKILLQFFGAYGFDSLSPALIESYKSHRLKEVKHTTINKELAALSGLCKWAAEKKYCAPIKIRRFPDKLTKAPLPDVPHQLDIEIMLESMIWPKCGLYYCLYYGGLRAEEAANLLAEKVDLSLNTMRVIGKGNKERTVPVLKDLRPVLEKRLNEVKKGYLWAGESGNPLTDLRPNIRWALKRADLDAHITPHSLRHAFAVRAVLKKIPLRMIQIVLGHSSIKVTEIYTQLAMDQIATEFDNF
jgi:site-specific recombinase XerD